MPRDEHDQTQQAPGAPGVAPRTQPATQGTHAARSWFDRLAVLPAREREELLRTMQTSDPQVALEVRELLRWHDSHAGALDEGLDVLASRLGFGPPPAPGLSDPTNLPPTIGPYRVLRVVGQGGMGVVYEAQSEVPRRRVAVKLVRPEFISASLLRRLTQEAHALARVQHPSIAAVYDVGVATVFGAQRPYLAMEFVEGTPLSPARGVIPAGDAQRRVLELLATIADAVDHAHRRGVVHRDLKPANILLDRENRPKILDFGVAHLTRETGDTSPTLHTQQGQLVGTPGYMSPEQLAASADPADPRADVYSLGTILYELLAGRPAFDLSGLGLLSAIDVVRRGNPTPLGKIDPRLRGDLEAIVACAMHADPAHRYQSAALFAEDIRRHLRHEPVQAHAPGAAYRTGKFLRRHWILATATGVVLLALSAALLVSLSFFRSATLAKHEAQDQAKAQRAARDFLASILESARPENTLGREMTVREALDAAAGNLRTAFLDQPAVREEVLTVVATTYGALGDHEKAVELFREAWQTARAASPSDPTAGSQAAALVAAHLDELYRSDEGEAFIRPIYEALVQRYGTEDLRTAQAELFLGMCLRGLGRREEGRAHIENVLRVREKLLGPDDPETLNALNSLALTLRDLGMLEETHDLSLRNLETLRRLHGEQHPDTIAASINHAEVIVGLGRREEAIELVDRAIAASVQLHGPRHPTTLAGRLARATILLDTGNRLAEAITGYQELLPDASEVFGPDHLRTMTIRNNLAVALERAGRLDEARDIVDQLLQHLQATEPESPRTMMTLSTASRIRRQLDQPEQALAFSTQSWAIAQKHQSPGSPLYSRMQIAHALALIDVGQIDEGNTLADQAVTALLAAGGQSKDSALRAMRQVQAALTRQAREDLAAVWTARALAEGGQP